ncbi:thiopeptide-type bacteriocin [Paenibacillus caui]|nr:thiopeptide-type bacteriocin [Paenibacillus caui]
MNMKEIEEKDFELELEVYEVSSATVLEEMGASSGYNSCSTVVVK